MGGSWDAAISSCDQAAGIFRDQCTGVAWELNTTWPISSPSGPSPLAGNLAQIARRRELLLREARERGDLHAETTVSGVSLARLGEDDPAGILEELRQAISRWPFPGFHVQHYHCMLRTIDIFLYCDNIRFGAGLPVRLAVARLRQLAPIAVSVGPYRDALREVTNCGSATAARCRRCPAVVAHCGSNAARAIERRERRLGECAGPAGPCGYCRSPWRLAARHGVARRRSNGL